MSQTDYLRDMAHQVMDTNWYLTLGTTEPDGRPRLSPVYFTHVGYRDLYWVSSPDAQHSRNVADRPEIAVVIFDSTAAIGQAKAVYINAVAAVIADDDLPDRCAAAFAHIAPGATRFQPDELSGDAMLRLYRAHVTSLEVHIAGRDPVYGTGLDSRRTVQL